MSEHEKKSMTADQDRRAFLATAGKFAVVVPPAMTVLMSTSLSSPAIALSAGTPNNGGSRGNNGLGNGEDPAPPGNPPVNDGPGTSPGNPGNGGGNNGNGNGKAKGKG